MFKWLKNIFGKKPEPLVLTDPIKTKDEVKVTERPKAPKPTKPKKVATAPVKEQVLVDTPKARKTKLKNGVFTAMQKKELLAYTKANSIPANASMKKEDIILAIKNA